MRLTVGPLPAAVYWRRRGVVLVGLAMIVLVISYACGGSGGSTAGADTGLTPTADSAATPALPDSTELAGSPTTPPAAFTLPGPANAAACTDAEIEVAAAAEAPQVQRDAPVEVTLKIKNISGRTCTRDVGADMQELSVKLADGSVTIWSSDDCNPRKGSDVRSFGPSTEFTFPSTWYGRRSRTGADAVNCSGGPPDAGEYQLLARLDQKVSAPFALRIQN